MTQTSPPGWHTDPGHTGIGPVQERWWDGTRWTDQLRIPPAAARRSRRIRIGAGVAAGLVALSAVGAGTYLMRDGSGNGTDASASTPSTSPSTVPSRPGAPGDGDREDGGGGGGSTGPDGQAPRTEDGYATDMASGISIPVPDGWTGRSGPVGAGITTGEYACPGDESQKCVRGGVFSAPAVALKLEAATAKEAAEKDIAANAKESYGDKIYEGITSHREIKSGAVTVAGRQGYLVRWKVVTKKGDDGYVESLAFPSPGAGHLLVVVRSGFDISSEAPKLSVLDEITKGIKAAPGGGIGSGSGRDA